MYVKLSTLIAVTALLGCTPVTGDVYESSEGITGSFILDHLAEEDQLAGGHVHGDKPAEAVEMIPEDRQFLEAQCSGCHTLDRIFATKGSRELWEKLLDQPHHQKAGFSEENKGKLLYIFRKYFCK